MKNGIKRALWRWGAGGAGLFLAAGAAPALALADQTWIAGEGYDSGTCASYQPCATLAFAQTQTAPGGTINIIDSANYGPLVITKALTIRSELGTAAVTTSIRIAAAATDKIMLLGLDLEGIHAGTAYPYGVKIEQAREVLIQNCRIKNYTGDPTNGAAVYIVNSGATRVTVDSSTLFNNTMGVIVSNAPGGGGHLKLYRSLLLANPTAGVRVTAAGNDALLVGNIILGSAKALDIWPGGAATSYGDNVLTSGDAPTLMSKN